MRFSHEHVGDLWQGDVMYGPYITIGKKKVQTYLHLFIDDASRYLVHAQFYLSQNFETLRYCFKEAVLRRVILSWSTQTTVKYIGLNSLNIFVHL